jgi:signal transduction histidine kinase
MQAISQVLADKTDLIFEQWKEKVRQDRQIDSAKELSESALANSIDEILDALIKALSYSEDNEFEVIAKASFEHGRLRANQGYDAAEIAREYRLLRQVIFSNLESELIEGSTQQQNRAFRLINAVIDEAISDCFTQFVQERTDALEQVQQQLALTNQELTRLLQASQESFSYLAHELKTPLNSIMGYSQLLLRQQERQTPEVATQIKKPNPLERVLSSSRQLLRLVNDALEISRFEAGKVKLRLNRIEVKAVVNSAVEMIEPLARAKELALEVNCDRAPSQVVTDAFRLQQIVTNLLSNAVRYTDEGSIRVECATLPEGKWSVAIADTGIGIPRELQGKIFDPYSRAFSDDEHQREGGTGLGLAIVSRLVNLLGGDITLESEAGEGSTFTVTFPLELTVKEEERADD